MTYQVSTDTDPGWLKFITDTRVAMDDSGLGKMASALDPMPPKFYEVSDLLGLAHRNPLLENRFRNYPPFLKLGERGDIQEIAGDTEFHGLLVQQASLADIMKHPLGKKVMANAELADILINQTDLADLKHFLENGESPLYAEERMLGRWVLNGNAMINHNKRNTPGIKGSELRALKAMVETYLDGASLVVYTDNSLKIVAPESAEADEEEEDEDQDQFGGGFGGQGAINDPYGGIRPTVQNPEMAQRYGLNPGARGGAGRQAQAAAQPKKPAVPKVEIAGGGSWERTGPGRYVLDTDGGMARANISKNRLLINGNGLKMVFSRIY